MMLNIFIIIRYLISGFHLSNEQPLTEIMINVCFMAQLKVAQFIIS